MQQYNYPSPAPAPPPLILHTDPGEFDSERKFEANCAAA